MQNKLGAYLGFARRAGKLALGVNAVKATKGNVYLLVADSAASENTVKEARKLAAGFGCALVLCDGVDAHVGKPGCKLIAVKDENFARAIAGELGGK